jgi:hypothetical protein
MTIRPSKAKLPAAGLAAVALLLAAASDSYAGPQVAGAGITPPGAIVLVGKGDSGSRPFRPPRTINLPPSPPVRDHRTSKYWHPPTSTSTAQGGVRVTRKKGISHPTPYVTNGGVRDHRSR